MVSKNTYDKFFMEQVREEVEQNNLKFDKLEYLNNKHYRDLKNKKFIIIQKWNKVNYDFYIERFILSEEELLQIKKGLFDIGVTKAIDKADLTFSKLYDEIYSESTYENEDRKLWEIQRIEQKIIGSKSSIKSKLKNDLNFDIDAFDETQKYSVLKLMKLLYIYEKDKEDNSRTQNIIKILAKPSLENVDNSSVGKPGKYGLLLAELRNDVRKEIKLDYHLKVQETINRISFKWNRVFKKVEQLYFSTGDGVRIKELERIHVSLQRIIVLLNSNKRSFEYEAGIFQSFYLKLYQHDTIALLDNLTSTVEFNINSPHTIELMDMPYNKEFKFDNVEIQDFTEYFNNNVEYITRLIFQINNITEAHVKKLEKVLKYVDVLHEKHAIRTMNTYALEFGRPKDLLFLVSCLQEIIQLNQLEKDDFEKKYLNNYFGSNVKSQTLSSALKNMEKKGDYDKPSDEVFDIIWVNKINRRRFWHMGFLQEYILTEKIGLEINEIMKYIFNIQNCNMMNAASEILLDRVLIFSDNTLKGYIDEFKNIIYLRTGYKCEIHKLELTKHFDHNDYMLFVADVISNVINYDSSGPVRVNQIVDVDLELSDVYKFRNEVYMFDFYEIGDYRVKIEFNKVNKIISILDYVSHLELDSNFNLPRS